MTITQDAVETRNPRDLITPELFGKLVERIQEDYVPAATPYVETMVEQMLAFLATSAVYDPDNPPPGVVTEDGWNKLTPSVWIDPALHAILDFTADFRQLSHKLTGGRFLDHLPITNDSIESGRSIALTVRAMRHYGWHVEDPMWERGTSCCAGCHMQVSDR